MAQDAFDVLNWNFCPGSLERDEESVGYDTESILAFVEVNPWHKLAVKEQIQRELNDENRHQKAKLEWLQGHQLVASNVDVFWTEIDDQWSAN